MKKNPYVLIIATSRRTRGGITSVIKAHEQGKQWNKYHCYWIETHIDGCLFIKLLYLFIALVKYIFLLPFYDIVHIHVSEIKSAIRKKIFVLLASLINKKIIIHFHSFSVDSSLLAFPNLYCSLFKKAHLLIVLSNQWKIWVEKYVNIKMNISVLNNPCPIIKNDTILYKKKIILYAGTVNERKGYIDLIRSFSLLAHKYPDWKLVVAGNGEIDKGKELAKVLRIGNQVEFLGWVRDAAKNNAFLSASIFCLPSYAEGFPMAVLDAWAYGLPVVTTPVGGLPDILVDGVNALVFNPGDINKLANNLEVLILNEQLRKDLSKASLKLSQEQFNINTIAKQLDNIYSEVGKK